MRRPSGTAKKDSKPGTKVLVVVLLIGGIAFALKPSIKWVKGQLLHRGKRLKWCEDVLESDSISQSDYAYCEDIWKY